MSPESLRNLFQAGAVSRDRSACLSADVLLTLAEGRLAEADRERAVEHLAACSDCAEELRLVRELEPARPWAARATAAAERPRVWSWSLGFGAALAAAAGLVLAIGVLVRSPGTAVAPSDTRRTGGSIERVEVIAPVAVVEGHPASFEWNVHAGAEAYRVRVFSEDGTPLWVSGEVRETHLEWPESLRLGPGRYYWQVEAAHAGEVLASSPLTPFTLGP